MKKPFRDSRKKKRKVGRPKTTGTGQAQIVRMHDNQIALIDAWIAKLGERISRPEAIRRLVEIGLSVKTNGQLNDEGAKQPQEMKKRARDLAGAAIDEMIDTTASPEDQAIRKRRLIKGPEEFQSVRRDRPKGK